MTVNAATTGRPRTILLVDDNPADVALIRELARSLTAPVSLAVARDGEEAVTACRDGAAPDLVMLDLNMPGMGGREVLEELKADPAMRRIPVLVLSTSASDRDVRSAYDHHANAFITKPIDLDALLAILKAVQRFWFTVARLPRPADGR